eukprot:1774260-Heterocapsa_arctica.AAC.1
MVVGMDEDLVHPAHHGRHLVAVMRLDVEPGHHLADIEGHRELGGADARFQVRGILEDADDLSL